jgi:phage baseplate assembly protein gpV
LLLLAVKASRRLRVRLIVHVTRLLPTVRTITAVLPHLGEVVVVVHDDGRVIQVVMAAARLSSGATLEDIRGVAAILVEMPVVVAAAAAMVAAEEVEVEVETDCIHMHRSS